MPLIWFPAGYQLAVRDYDYKLAEELLPWIKNTFEISSVTVAPQQDEAPEHISNRMQRFLQ